jgi:hypothetical protein
VFELLGSSSSMILFPIYETNTFSTGLDSELMLN